MNRETVRSSNLRSIGYDPATLRLEVEFQSGSVYEYSGVPLAVAAGLRAAASKGAYFHTHIRDSYSSRQVR